jgi:hypothetical protein
MYEHLPKGTLALLSIGVPKNQQLTEDDQAELYRQILPVVKGIELFLLMSTLSHGRPRKAHARGVQNQAQREASNGTNESPST